MTRDATSSLDAESAAARKLASSERASASTSLETFIEQVRRKVAEATPPEKARAPFAETADPRLASALAVAEAAPSPEGYRAVSREYYRLGISDRALAYLERALVLDVRDGATYDALARIWRDGGVPDRALADGYRAVYFAPLSAAAHNTLGTVFQALGRSSDARREYQRAIDLDASAAYALNNLCYAWMLEREAAKAEAACRQALTVDPSFRAARNNLALAYAASGKMDAARVTFDAADDKAEAQYNIGIVQLARRRYGDAVSAFAAAQQLRPEWRQATVRARQAEQLARAGAEE